MKKIATLNRIEVIDWTDTAKIGQGRAYVKWDKEDFIVSLDYQDNKKTLKIFLTNKP